MRKQDAIQLLKGMLDSSAEARDALDAYNAVEGDGPDKDAARERFYARLDTASQYYEVVLGKVMLSPETVPALGEQAPELKYV